MTKTSSFQTGLKNTNSWHGLDFQNLVSSDATDSSHWAKLPTIGSGLMDVIIVLGKTIFFADKKKYDDPLGVLFLKVLMLKKCKDV